MQGLITIPGVMGSMVSDENGAILAHSFPPFFDTSTLKGAAEQLQDKTIGLQDMTGGVSLFDLRFELGRLIIKVLPTMFVVVLCQPTVNIQLLSISLNVAVKKIEKISTEQIRNLTIQQTAQTIYVAPISAQMPPAPPVAAAPIAQIFTAPRQFQQQSTYSNYRALTDEKGVLLYCDTMEKTANTYWESMTDSANINRDTALEISVFFKTGPFKKLTVTNLATKLSKHIPISVIQHDREHIYDGKIIITKALTESLKIKPGDQVRVEVMLGGGILGWEGI